MKQVDIVKERRSKTRVPARLQIELTLDSDSDASERTSTINISANGVYFTSKRFIEPLTKLGLKLFLMGEEANDEFEAMDVQGVVVRTDPEAESTDTDTYEIACYFTDTSPEFRERLGFYVQAQF